MRDKKKCLVLSCENTSQNKNDTIFFAVPKGLKRNDWLVAVKRIPGSISLQSNHYCCQNHFNVSIILNPN